MMFPKLFGIFLPLLLSRSPVLFQQYEDKNRTGVEPGLTEHDKRKSHHCEAIDVLGYWLFRPLFARPSMEDRLDPHFHG